MPRKMKKIRGRKKKRSTKKLMGLARKKKKLLRSLVKVNCALKTRKLKQNKCLMKSSIF